MANKNDSEARALLDALCAWLVEDAQFMQDHVNRLRERFEAAAARPGTYQRDRPDDTKRPGGRA